MCHEKVDLIPGLDLNEDTNIKSYKIHNILTTNHYNREGTSVATDEARKR